MPPSREPWIKVRIGIAESDKVALLPSGEARWGWIRVLCAAKTQRRMGVFANRRHVADLVGRHGRYVKDYLTAGLLHLVPDACRCMADYGDTKDGEVVVHDYREEQIAPGGPLFHDPEESPGALRTRWWRMRTAVFQRDAFTCRYCGTTDYERRWLVADHVVPPEQGGEDTMENLVTACRPCNSKKGGRTPEQAGMPIRDLSQPAGDTSRDTSQRQVTSRALSPSQSLSPSGSSPPSTVRPSPREAPNGMGDDLVSLQVLAEELTGQPYALANLAGRMGEMVRHQLEGKGMAAVTQAWQTVAAAVGPSPTIRQIVLGADDLLFPVPRMGRQSPEDAKRAERDEVIRSMRERAGRAH